jgi:uncharacterized protein (DUF342 family)
VGSSKNGLRSSVSKNGPSRGGGGLNRSSPGAVMPVSRKVSVGKGYARKGALIARVTHAIQSRDGKNLFGETVPAEKVYQPRLVAGSNIRVEQGSSYYMGVDGVVELYRDDRGVHYVSARMYREGGFTVSVSDDEMEATLTVVPPVGGAGAVTREQVMSECTRKGIVFGLDREAVDEAVGRASEGGGEVKDVVIARGERPVDGNDGSFVLKASLASGTPFKLMENGRVDFREHDRITNVDQGQLIAVVKKAMNGVKDGCTVRGAVIKAAGGREVDLEVGNNIMVEDRGRELHFRSAIGGQLLLKGRFISVEPVLQIGGDVGPATGNVEFDGNVEIKGSVQDNFRVVAKKRVTIDGNVGCSVVKAGEDLIVRNGVVGKNRARMLSKGNITVKFAENAVLSASGSIYIQRAALNCELTAGERVICTTEKGQIIGGRVRAKKGVEVRTLGNDSEHKMDVCIGSDFFLENTLSALRDTKKKYEEGVSNMVLILEKLKKVQENPADLPEKLQRVYVEARKKRALLSAALQNIARREQQIESRLGECWEAEVIVHDSLYRGVRIYFGDSTTGNPFLEPEETRKGVRVYFDRTYGRMQSEKLILR